MEYLRLQLKITTESKKYGKLYYEENSVVRDFITNNKITPSFERGDYLKYHVVLRNLSNTKVGDKYVYGYTADFSVLSSDLNTVIYEEKNYYNVTRTALFKKTYEELYFVHFINELSSGQYVLKIIFTDIVSGQKQTAYAKVVVVENSLVMTEPVVFMNNQYVAKPSIKKGEPFYVYFDVANLTVVSGNAGAYVGLKLTRLSDGKIMLNNPRFSTEGLTSDKFSKAILLNSSLYTIGTYELTVFVNDIVSERINFKKLIFEVVS